MDISSFEYIDDLERKDYMMSRASIHNMLEILEKLGFWDRAEVGATPFNIARKIANEFYDKHT